MEIGEKERISQEKAVELLKKDGLTVSVHEAKLILDFLYNIAEIVVDQYLSEPQ